MSGTWASDWSTGDVVTAAEFRKSLGCVADSTLGIAAASFDFTGLPTTYASLLIMAYLRSDEVAGVTVANIRFNNDSGANYDWQAAPFVNTSSGGAGASVAATAGRIAHSPGSSIAANRFGAVAIWIPNYSGATNDKSAVALSGFVDSAAATSVVASESVTWRSTAAINRVTLLPFSGNFIAGSRASVYVMGS